jgi:hypothetical protein
LESPDDASSLLRRNRTIDTSDGDTYRGNQFLNLIKAVDVTAPDDQLALPF